MPDYVTFRVREGRIWVSQLGQQRPLNSIENTLNDADAVVFAVPHKDYLSLDPDAVFEMIGNKPAAIIDCFGILNDTAIQRYFEMGCEVKGLGRGHVKRIKDSVNTGN